MAIFLRTGLFLLTACSTAPLLPPSIVDPVTPPDLQVTIRERLKEAKANWKLSNYEAIATREGDVSCVGSEEGCNALHLVTGHACFRVSNYQCAADHLESGMQQTETWDFDGLGFNRQKTYLNLLESLRSMQGIMHGEEGKKNTERLLSLTKAFMILEPKNQVGTFFLSSAQFATIRREGTKEPRRHCQELGALLSALQKAGPPSSSIRYQTYYRQLLSDIAGAKQVLRGCP